MNPIVKIFTGKHIDLSKIVSISDAEFFNRMGSGGWSVGFEIECQLLDKPIRYERSLAADEYKFDNHYRLVTFMASGNLTSVHISDLNCDSIKSSLAICRLQDQIDEIIKLWKEYKDSEKS